VHHSKFGKSDQSGAGQARTEGVHTIAARFGVDPGTVQKISINRPFAGGSEAA
jgi:hypothetical protein